MRDGVDQPLRAERPRPIERLDGWQPKTMQTPGDPTPPARQLFNERG